MCVIKSEFPEKVDCARGFRSNVSSLWKKEEGYTLVGLFENGGPAEAGFKASDEIRRRLSCAM
jgi:hypothetical protein